jgi:uncharacterized membrane protein
MELLALLLAVGVLWVIVWVWSRLLLVAKLERRIQALEMERRLPTSSEKATEKLDLPSVLDVGPPEAISTPPPMVRPLPLPPPLPPSLDQSAPEQPVVEKPFMQSMWLKKLFGENPVVRIGLLVFLLGISFLVRLAAQAGLFPPELRLLIATGAGVALLTLGWKFRTTRPTFALPLQGGAMGIMLLVVFAAFRLFELLSAGVALSFAVGIVIATGFLAVLQNARSLAFLGLVAGFAAPLLLSTGSGNHVALFAYYGVLNAAVFGIAWFRSWRVLHLSAFIFTYGIGIIWGVLDYQSIHFWSCELFLWLYYILFATTAWLFARRSYQGVFGYVDGTLTFGLPLATLAIQYTLVEYNGMAMAWSAVVLSLHHLCLAFWLWRTIRLGRAEHLRTFAETLAVLGTIFASLALPLALSERATAIAWAIEGAGLAYLGLRQQRIWSLSIGTLLLIAAWIMHWNLEQAHWVATTVIAVSLFSYAWCIEHLPTRWNLAKAISILPLLGLWGLLLHDVTRFISHWESTLGSITLVIIAVAAVLRWSRPAWMVWPLVIYWLLAVLVEGVSLLDRPSQQGFFQNYNWTTYLLLPIFSVLGLVLVRYRSLLSLKNQDWLQGLLFYGILWFISVSIYTNTHALVSRNHSDWAFLGLCVPSVIALGLVGSRFMREKFFDRWSSVLYAGAGMAPLVLGVVILAVSGLAHAAAFTPIPYLPLINPLDLLLALVILFLLRLPKTVWNALHCADLRYWVIPLLLLLAFPGASLNRIFHFYGGVTWDWSILWNERGLQAGWSLLLTAEALGLMWWAARRSLRVLWMGGALLLALAVLKLFLVDLSGQGTVARIVSFLGVGALMVAIGYFSPLPPSNVVSEE